MTLLYKSALWAKENARLVQIYFVFVHIILSIMAIYMGWYLYASGVELPIETGLFFLLIYNLAVILYPGLVFDRKKSKADTFKKRKVLDAILLPSAFLMVISLANYSPSIFTDQSSHLQEARPVLTVVKMQNGKRQPLKNQSLYQVVENRINNRLSTIRKWKSKSPRAEQIGLIILFIFLATMFMGLALALSCNLACSGMTSAANLVMVLGIVLSLFILIAGISWAIKRYKRQTTGTT